MKKVVKSASLIILSLYLLIPLGATFLYSFATQWSRTVLPEGLTFKWYQLLFSDSEFISSLLHSLLLTGGTTLAAVLIMVPAIYGIVLYFPQFERLIKWTIIGVYTMPGIISSVGLLKGYANTSIPMLFVVGGAYFVSILPFMYQGIRNNLRNINVVQLVEAAEILGASKLVAFRKIILPNIMPGVVVSALLSFSVLFGEFVMINILLGSNFKTIQIYLMENLQKNGHISSAIVSCYFILLALITLIILKYTLSKKGEHMNELHHHQTVSEDV
ncbi:ABC transporter permease [Macrococcus bovicus]|uniref:ABC transporter permease n=1 Tax=Macrococcus bovicus TaxID=69968 RepID=UPI0025A5057B|nr:ABC transporter permease subunit [Macrococcus bovicus]WJP97376.1 ABC transporter permease subunit [Macrococcus bovicus]